MHYPDDIPMDESMDRNKKKQLLLANIYFFDFDLAGLEKPWTDSRNKLEDYFNYGRFKLQINIHLGYL